MMIFYYLFIYLFGYYLIVAVVVLMLPSLTFSKTRLFVMASAAKGAGNN